MSAPFPPRHVPESDAGCRECPCPPGEPGGEGICECECHSENRVIPPGEGS